LPSGVTLVPLRCLKSSIDIMRRVDGNAGAV
jgi:hypothetical protein